MKFILPLFVIVIWAMTHGNASAQAPDLCVLVNGVLTNNQLDGGKGCTILPDSYTITIFEMGFCRSTITPPTTTAAAVYNNCHTIFTSPGGTVVEVKSGVATSLPATSASKPPNGVYITGYAVLALGFQIKTVLTFDTATAGDVGNGTICWTLTKQISSQSNTAPRAQCANAAPDPGNVGTLTDLMDDFGTNNFSSSSTAAYGLISAYIIKSNGFLLGAGEHAQADKLLGIQAMTNSVTVTNDTSIINMGIETSKGSSVVFSATDVLRNFGSGPFSVDLTAQ